MDDPDLEVAVSLANYTGERLAKLLLLLIDTVSRTHPDLLREAIGRVFDLTLYEEQARKAKARLGRVHEEALAIKQEIADLRNQMNDLRQPPAVVLRQSPPKRTA